MKLSQPLIDGKRSLEHLYVRFRNFDTAEVVVFAVPKRVGIRRAIDACRPLLDGTWYYVEEDDRYGDPVRPVGGFDHLKVANGGRGMCNTGANKPGHCALGGIGCDVDHDT